MRPWSLGLLLSYFVPIHGNDVLSPFYCFFFFLLYPDSPDPLHYRSIKIRYVLLKWTEVRSQVQLGLAVRTSLLNDAKIKYPTPVTDGGVSILSLFNFSFSSHFLVKNHSFTFTRISKSILYNVMSYLSVVS